MANPWGDRSKINCRDVFTPQTRHLQIKEVKSQYHMAQLTKSPISQPLVIMEGEPSALHVLRGPWQFGRFIRSPSWEACPSQLCHPSKEASGHLHTFVAIHGICLSMWCSLEEFPHRKPIYNGNFFIKICTVEIMLMKLECNYRLERFFAVWIELL